jgi:HNH endonuclease
MDILTREQLFEFLMKRDGTDCFLCGTPFINQHPTIDHWIPKAAGGGDEVENLRLMHRKCNLSKGDLIPNADGTLPPRPQRVSGQGVRTRQRRNELLSKICYDCDDGRKLVEGETCYACGIDPGPPHAPRYLKKRSPECDHAKFWCWACSIGIVERKEAIMGLIYGE